MKSWAWSRIQSPGSSGGRSRRSRTLEIDSQGVAIEQAPHESQQNALLRLRVKRRALSVAQHVKEQVDVNRFAEMEVRSLTGAGAEKAVAH